MVARQHSSIPGYKPGPILSGPRKVFLSSLFIIPAVAYIYLRKQQIDEGKNRRLLEEEGRKNWATSGGGPAKDLSVSVGRSGGGI